MIMKIALIGYGKMGHIIEEVARERGHQVVCTIDKDNLQDFDSEAFATADVAIEFTTPATAEENIRRAWSKGKPVVCGTTGWNVEQCVMRNAQCVMGNALVWSSNYSIGVNILFALNKQLAKIMQRYPEYTPSITEVHHVHKLDAPSGTAKALQQCIMHNAQCTMEQVSITSIRKGEVPGIHTVTWDSEVDTISISHSAKSRKGFAFGAVLAAEWIVGKKGYHTFDEVIDLSAAGK